MPTKTKIVQSKSICRLSCLWIESIGEQKYHLKTNSRSLYIDFANFLACYHPKVFQKVSLPHLWHRIDCDQQNQQKNKKKSSKLSEEVVSFLQNIGNRGEYLYDQIPTDWQIRQIDDDWNLKEVIDVTLIDLPDTNRDGLETYLKKSQYGAIGYNNIRNQWIHKGQLLREENHSFSGMFYASHVYETPPCINFPFNMLLDTFKSCIDGFESDCIELAIDPVPDKLL